MISVGNSIKGKMLKLMDYEDDINTDKYVALSRL